MNGRYKHVMEYILKQNDLELYFLILMQNLALIKMMLALRPAK